LDHHRLLQALVPDIWFLPGLCMHHRFYSIDKGYWFLWFFWIIIAYLLQHSFGILILRFQRECDYCFIMDFWIKLFVVYQQLSDTKMQQLYIIFGNSITHFLSVHQIHMTIITPLQKDYYVYHFEIKKKIDI
jgi:hypothetical protein